MKVLRILEICVEIGILMHRLLRVNDLEILAQLGGDLLEERQRRRIEAIALYLPPRPRVPRVLPVERVLIPSA